MEFRTIQVDEFEAIHTITLNRPERRNALNPAMLEELTRALQDSERCTCSAVILTGAGSSFCAGMDIENLKAMLGEGPEEERADLEAFLSLMRRLYELDKPTIAAVNGPALAGGTGLAFQCDFTLAAAGAKFGYTEVRIGFIPAVASVFLIAMIGEKQARDLLLSGRLFLSEEAQRLGLVTAITSEDELIPHARSLAHALARNSPQAMSSMKRLLGNFAKADFDRRLEHALEWSERVHNMSDFREGIQAFLEKRDPVWTYGREKEDRRDNRRDNL